MNLYRPTAALILATALLTILSGCASVSVQRVNAPSNRMTVYQARTALVQSLGHLYSLKSVRDFKFTRDKVAFIGDSSNGNPRDCSLSFAGLKKLAVRSGGGAPFVIVTMNGSPMSFYKHGFMGDPPDSYFQDARSAQIFIDALLILKDSALVPDTEAADFAAFTVEAKTWLSATPKPAMSDEARTYKVLAEDALERKDVPAALDSFCKALDKHPMWPKGQYNAAIMAGESQDYELAAQHMRRYLVLASDAPDAREAKDKLLLWQHKAKDFDSRQPESAQPVAYNPMPNNVNAGAQTCFIATAAYGTPWQPNVVTLRCFRERYLRSNALGRWLVSVYYHSSPPVADYIHERPWARGFTRAALTPAVILAGALLGEPADLVLLSVAIICCLLCLYYRKEIKMLFSRLQRHKAKR